jgi:hypothetical protein
MRLAICIVGLLCAVSCGGGKTKGPAGAVSLSGKLVSGTQTQPSSTPLAGYKLYCVTFAEPPTAATGAADAAGQVTISLDALNVAFGCFVLDPQGNGVATVIFKSGSQIGQTITLTGDANLGTITVDLGNGVAVTGVAPTGSLTGTSGLACPLGEWKVTVPSTGPCGDVTSVIAFMKTADGKYLASFTVGPLQDVVDEKSSCNYHSYGDLPAADNGGVLTFSFPHDPLHCPSRLETIVTTANSDCTQLTFDGSFGPCVSCDSGGCDCNVGSLTCKQQYTGTRQP